MSISTNACRICTLEHLVGANISDEYYSTDSWNRCFTNLVEACAPKLAGDYCANSLPDTICITCKQEVLRLHRFVTALLKSDAFFKRGYRSKQNDELESEENYLMDCHEVKDEMHNEFKLAKQNGKAKSGPCNGEESYFIDCYNVKNEIHNEVVDTKTEIVYCQVVESKVSSVHPDVAIDRDILKTDPFSDNEIMQDDSDMDMECTPLEIQDAASEANKGLIPDKSKEKYENAYTSYITWRNQQKRSKTTENVLLTYLHEKSQKVKSPTLWALYSMLKTTINIKENVNIANFTKLIPFLKRKSVGYIIKQSKILTREDINRFLTEANDECYLLIKVVLIIGISGACRRDELVKMNIDNVEDNGSFLIFKVPDTKNYSRTFTVTNLDHIDIYRKYMKLRPSHTTHRRLFIKYYMGKCTIQAVGVNKIGAMPSLVAKFLKLSNPEAYTGHCFRRTSATLLGKASRRGMIGISRMSLKITHF